MNHAIAALLLGEITWERAYVLEIVKKETVDINMYRRRSTYGNFHAEFSPRVNEEECQTTRNPFPELLRVRAKIFKKVLNGIILGNDQIIIRSSIQFSF